MEVRFFILEVLEKVSNNVWLMCSILKDSSISKKGWVAR